MALQQDVRIMGILKKYVEEVKAVYGPHLMKMILYGSYARGDYTSESDVDVMILVDLDIAEMRNLRPKLSDVTFDINYNHNILIMPLVQNKDFFERWIGAYPFFNSVNNEGVELYAAL